MQSGSQQALVPSTPLIESKDKDIEQLKVHPRVLVLFVTQPQRDNSSLRMTVAQLTKEQASLQAQFSLLENNAQSKQQEQEKQLLVLQHENNLLQFDKQELHRQVGIWL